MELTHLSLFSGIGGIDLAAEWAGFRTICFVEIDKYCQKVLKKHWPNVPIIEDIKDATAEKIMGYTESRTMRNDSQNFRQVNEEVNTFDNSSASSRDGRSGRVSIIIPITLITGGFPCQPVSDAGKRRGAEDDRWLWPEMFRVISEVRSTWVVAENVTGLIRLGIRGVLSNLESIGYETLTLSIPACSINAKHRRQRIFVVAHTKSNGMERCRWPKRKRPQRDVSCGSCENVAYTNECAGQQSVPQSSFGEAKGCGKNIPNTEGKGLEGAEPERKALPWGCLAEYFGDNWWSVEPNVGRVAYGVPSRVDRLKCLGNAVVPQQIYHILKGIAEIERMKTK